jgi:hypothetical protein
MPTVRGFSAACALVLALVLLLSGPGAASAATPADIFRDYVRNGVITGDYAFDDLVAALETAKEDALYGDFASAVEDKLDASILGRSPGRGGGLGGGATASSSPLPEPRTPDQSGDPPWPFLALSVLAGALVVTGAGSSLYRRARR